MLVVSPTSDRQGKCKPFVGCRRASRLEANRNVSSSDTLNTRLRLLPFVEANVVARMEYTREFDFRSFDSGSGSFNAGSGSVEWTDLAPIFHLDDPNLLPVGVWDTTTTDLEDFWESSYTPFIFPCSGNGSEPMLLDGPVAVEDSRDAQHKPAPPISHTTLNSPNLQSYGNIVDLAIHDIPSPPNLSMSSTSSSESSSFSYESTPMTTRRRQRKPLKRPTTRSSLPAISQQKLEVLGNALFFHNLTPTADQSSFLAKSLHVDESILESWQKALFVDGISILEGLKLGKPPKEGRVASWKQTIIRRGLQKVNAPSSCQIEFLAAGLRLRVEQLRQSFREEVNNGIHVGAKSRRRIETELLQTTRLSKEPPPPPDDKVQPVDSTEGKATQIDDSTNPPLPSKPSTVGVDSLDSPPWVPLMQPETNPANHVDVSDAKSQNCQHLQSIVDKTESVPDCKQSVEQTSAAVSASNISDDNMESIVEEEAPDLSPGEELAALLGPEYCHLTESILSRFAAESVWDQWQFASGSRQHGGGAENTPSSNSSQTPGNTSSPNTSASGSSGGKRKSSGGSGGDGPGDLEPNDGDGNMEPPPPKKAKAPQLRYDCPVFRRSLGTRSMVRSCALNGLEFRNLWCVTYIISTC